MNKAFNWLSPLIKHVTYIPGDIVYLITDAEQLPRIVVSVHFSATGIWYSVMAGIYESEHSPEELTSEKNTNLFF
jgi:hypothetical protein